ncbi:hypothetical protein [Salinisphaera hydrothermalis]|uniref:Uncharacterized protein n=1 Tax=Salinisphaera hydrothermalis (strain C41B8) TaxID=1304275 RepID=A0A084IG97_SALHC|nr:hypothetical protein [Salinisphaera hydrothermalis]KEZ75731.1 hypothetical protein C41B8_18552 [Salinisphaera hydrothermalis C41B8]
MPAFINEIYTPGFKIESGDVMKSMLRPTVLLAGAMVLGASLQGCVLAAGAAAGAAGGYEAKKHGYDVQSPVKKDSAGGYKGQAPVVKHPEDDSTSSSSSSHAAEPADAGGHDADDDGNTGSATTPN